MGVEARATCASLAGGNRTASLVEQPLGEDSSLRSPIVLCSLGPAILLRLQAVSRQRADVVTSLTRARDHDALLVQLEAPAITVLAKEVASEDRRIRADGAEPV